MLVAGNANRHLEPSVKPNSGTKHSESVDRCGTAPRLAPGGWELKMPEARGAVNNSRVMRL